MFQLLRVRSFAVCLVAVGACVCFFGSVRLATAADNATAGSSVYHADPQHLWNRLHAALFDRVGPDGKTYRPDRIEPLLWPGTKHLLEDRFRDRVLALLEEFLKQKGETLIEDPLKRAVLQRDLWLVFNWLEGEHSNFQPPELTPQKVSASRHQLRRPLAAVIGRLALSPDQIERLPDNFAAAVASGEFAKSYDPTKPDQAYLPPELFAADGPWVCVGRSDGGIVARLHLRDDNGNSFTNSTFLVFLRLPDGRAATLDYLQRLRDEPRDQNVANTTLPKLPQFPKGTEVALVRRALLIAAPHTLTPTALTESIQLRVYREVPELTPQSLKGGGNNVRSWQSSFEFRLRRSRLFAGQAGGLHAAYPTQLDFKTGFGNKFRDPFDDSLRSSETFPLARQESVTGVCFACHSYPGVYSFNSFRNFRGGGGGDNGPAPLAAMSLAEVNQAAIKWKLDRPNWSSLRRLLAE